MKNQPLVVGVAAAVITIVIGVGLVLAIAAGDDNASGTAGPDAPSSEKSSTTKSSSSSKSSGKSTSTTSTTTTAPSVATAPTAPVTTPTTVPTPPETDTPDIFPEDAYQHLPLPGGLSATIDTCSWSAANGGQLQAGGTLTNVSAAEDIWLLNVVWLFRNGPQDETFEEQSDTYDLEVGQSTPWNLTIGAPSAPPGLSCALEVE